MIQRNENDKSITMDFDRRFKNPFKGDFERYMGWILSQTYVIDCMHDLMDNGYTFIYKNEAYKHVLDTISNMTRTVKPILVFGSNTAGRHGAGVALFAKLFRGAKVGIGEGPTGTSYALPTKDSRIETLPLDDIEENILAFFQYAKANPNTTFQLTRIGCNLAGYRDEQIAPLAIKARDKCDVRNVLMPQLWLPEKEQVTRWTLAGSRELEYDDVVADLKASIERNIPPGTEIVVGCARGMDAISEEVAIEMGYPVIRMPAYWELYGKPAGYYRNEAAAVISTGVLIYMKESSKGSASMLELVTKMGHELILSIRR